MQIPREYDLAKVFELAARGSTVAATAALVASVIHDWVYLSRLGLAFSDVPTSLADHGRSALIWLPPLGLGLAGVSVYELLTKRIEGWRTESEIVAASPNPRFFSLFRRSGDLVPLVAALLTIPAYVLLGGEAHGLQLGVVALWVFFLRWVYAHPRSPLTRIGTLALLWGGLCIILVMFRGSADADAALTSTSPVRIITMKSDQRVMRVTLLRTYEKGALVKRQDEPQIEFVFWSEIESFKIPYTKHEPYVGLLCRVWPSGCRAPNK